MPTSIPLDRAAKTNGSVKSGSRSKTARVCPARSSIESLCLRESAFFVLTHKKHRSAQNVRGKTPEARNTQLSGIQPEASRTRDVHAATIGQSGARPSDVQPEMLGTQNAPVGPEQPRDRMRPLLRHRHAPGIRTIHRAGGAGLAPPTPRPHAGRPHALYWNHLGRCMSRAEVGGCFTS